jgi:succinate dehydrogenase / fumarate reductase, membrane anchor subunit
MQKSLSDRTPKKPPNRAGARMFWRQRTTAMMLVVLVPYALIVLLRLAGNSSDYVRFSLSKPWLALPVLALVLVGTVHMWIGMREILEDYIRKPLLGVTLTLNTLFCLAVALAASAAVLRLWLGA